MRLLMRFRPTVYCIDRDAKEEHGDASDVQMVESRDITVQKLYQMGARDAI